MPDANITRDLIKLMETEPSTITFSLDGVNYPAIRGALSQSRELQDGGFYPDLGIQIATTIKKFNADGHMVDRFPSGKPVDGDTVNFDATDYLCRRVTYDPTKSIVQLELMEK